jgi:hypothetical protein
MTRLIKPPMSPDDYVKLTVKKAEKYNYYTETEIPRMIKELETTKMLMQMALDIEQHRDGIISEWNQFTPEQRRNIGKSRDEIENGENAQSRSPITFEHFADKRFDEMPEYMQAMYLTGRIDDFKKQYVGLTI